MNKLLFILLVFSAFKLNAQVVDHFSEPTSKWYVVKAFPNGSMEHPSFVGKRTFVYGFNGDSLINNETWLKMYSTEDESFQSDLNFEGYIHSQNGIVRYTNVNTDIDTLYNFSLLTSDSVNYEFYDLQDVYIDVLNISNVSISGENHSYFSFSEPEIISSFNLARERWIEGIGSIHGPLYPLNPIMFSTEIPDSLILSCTKTNGVDYYSHYGFSECFELSLVAVDNIENELFNVLPNPFTEELTVNLNSPNVELLELRNLNGQVVFSSNEFNENISILTSHLPAGIYFLTVLTSSESHSVKLVK